MPKKNRKSVEPVSLPFAAAYFHPRDWEDYRHEVDEMWLSEKMAQFKRRAMRNNISLDSSNDWYFDDAREACIKEAAVSIAKSESEKAFWSDVKYGKLVLVGCRDTGDGRLWRLPEYVWTDPGGFEDWRKGRVSGGGLVFVNVRVLKAAEAEKVPEFSYRRRSRVVDKEPALNECETDLLKERKRWKAAGCPKKGWKPQQTYKKEALDHWQKRGLTHRAFDALFTEVFPELKGNKGKSGWCPENDNHQWISDT